MSVEFFGNPPFNWDSASKAQRIFFTSSELYLGFLHKIAPDTSEKLEEQIHALGFDRRQAKLIHLQVVAELSHHIQDHPDLPLLTEINRRALRIAEVQSVHEVQEQIVRYVSNPHEIISQ